MITGQQQLTFLNSILGCFCLGIFLAVKLTVPMPVLFGGLFLLVLGAGWSVWKNNSYAAYIFCVLFLLLGWVRFLQAELLPADDISIHIGQEVKVRGTLIEAPRVAETSDGYQKIRYVVCAEQVQKEKQNVKTSGVLYVYARKEHADEARIGDHIIASGDLKGLQGYQNPGRIDIVAAAKRQGITARLQTGKRAVRIEPEKNMLFLRQIQLIRTSIMDSLQRAMTTADAAAIFAMLFGGYGGIRPELLEAFTTTGIVHILSVSGSHITLLAATVGWLGKFLRLRRSITALFVIALILAYGVMAGGVPPVIRSAIMGILSFVAFFLEREKDTRRILSIIGLVMLMLQPELLFDVSFQLSFAATAGLLYLSPVLCAKMKRIPEWLAANFAITIGAQLAVLPFLAWYFNRVSVSALLANVIAVPLVEYIIIVGLAASLIGLLLPFLQHIMFVLASLTLGIVYEITSVLSCLPGSAVYLPSFSFIVGGVYYGGLAFLLQPEAEKHIKVLLQYKKQLGAAGIVLAAVLFLYCQRTQLLQVHFIDVGQGDASLIITPHGTAVMIDTGGTREGAFDIGSRVDVPYIWHYSVQQLDTIFLTHAHEDHAAGAAGIMKKMKVKHVIIGRENREEYAKSMQLSAETEPVYSFVPATAGQRFIIDDVCFEVLYAADPVKSGTGNETSNVIRVSYGRASFIFTGDLTAEAEKKMLQEGIPLKSSVLKVAHHGSNTSNTADFLQAVQPIWTVISVGADNSFGHPNKAVLERLAAQKTKVLRTDEKGAVVFATDGKSIHVRTFVDNEKW